VHLREEGIRHDVVAAAFAQRDTVEDNLVRLIERVNALQSFLASSDGASLLIAYRRASNIVTIEERKDDRRYDGTVNASLLVLPEEQALNLKLSDSGRRVAARLLNERFEDAMASLATLRQPIDEFFEHVTVNVDDPKLRENRLRLLARIRATMNQVADFSQIEG
jgi:glycyl-tRNA synthetase beta chain